MNGVKFLVGKVYVVFVVGVNVFCWVLVVLCGGCVKEVVFDI